MKQNLGKFALGLLMLSISLFAASVEVTVDKPAIYKGDSVRYTITAKGKNVIFPQIQKIGSFDILGQSSSQNTTIINGQLSQSYSKTYSFQPTKSLTIPSVTVEVDGETEKTKTLDIKVLKPTVSTAGDPFVLELKADKQHVHVGESVRLDVKLKHELDARADKVQLAKPEIENFWIKEIDGSTQDVEGDYSVTTYSYILFAQKPGTYTIPSLEGAIGTRQVRRNFGGNFFDDPFFSAMGASISWQKIFSNDLKIDVAPLPDNLEVYGNFKIKANVDKQKVSANQPVNLTLHVTGKGNIDDIKKFEFNIPNAVVYSDEPKIIPSFENNQYGGEFIQKIAVVSDRNYTIPALTFNYFDAKKKKEVSIQTTPFDIEVTGGMRTHKLAKIENSDQANSIAVPHESKTKVVVKEVPAESSIKYFYLLLGFILGIATMYGYIRYSRKKDISVHKPMIYLIKKSKDDKELYNLLLPYSKEGGYITEVLQLLEENLYQGKNHKIDKIKLIDYFEEVVPAAGFEPARPEGGGF